MEFERSKGQALGGPGAWIEQNMPLCPLCKRVSEWETATAFVLNVKRHYFRCSNCQAVLSASAATIIPVPTPVNLAIKPVIGLVRVESVGRNEELERLAGKEHNLSELQEWARKSSSGYIV